MSRMPAVQYEVAVASAARHRYAVTLRIAHPQAEQQVSLPAWIPGSYLIREFARHLDHLQAEQAGQALPVQQLDKSSWRIRANPQQPLTLRYEVYAFDASVRAAWLDTQRGFFNGTSLLLRVQGQEQQAQRLTVRRPRGLPGWQLATAMAPLRVDRHGFGSYEAADYDELVDHPVEMGAFWSGRFTARGLKHRFVVAGAPAATFDGAQLLRDTQKICETQIGFWHGTGRPRRTEYVFMLNATSQGYGGIEHRASTALVCSRSDLPRRAVPGASATPQRKGYQTLLGVISHEYFHSWNVKRLKPAEFAPYDYARENHTELLWFFEGFTSYYDDLLLHRAGLIDEAAYFKLLTHTINRIRQAPGRHVQSLAQASFDAWTRFYRPHENTANSTVSYYGKGALVALCLDLTLRHEGRGSLDDVMRALWKRCKGGPMTEADVAAVLADLGGRPYDPELADWVHGTADLPLQALLQQHGVALVQDPAPIAQALGLRVTEKNGIAIDVVLDGGPAARAGMAAGDEWLGLEVTPAATEERKLPMQAWRLRKLDDLAVYAGPADACVALVARDGRLLRLPLALPGQASTWRLQRPADTSTTSNWPAPVRPG
ncbi:MAG: peptidase M61 [Ottowia sp.]|nr:peptidase M61 [Ottowia sp.]